MLRAAVRVSRKGWRVLINRKDSDIERDSSFWKAGDMLWLWKAIDTKSSILVNKYFGSI